MTERKRLAADLERKKRKMSDRKTASFDEFKAYTIALVRGDQAVDPSQPKIWVEPKVGGENSSANDLSNGRSNPKARGR